MREDYAAQFIVGAATAIAAAVFDLAASGQVDAGWVLAAFAVPYAVLHLYQRAGFSPSRTWRVRDNELIARGGHPTGHGAWELDAAERRDWVVHGPRRPLGRGRYRAVFRLKVNYTAGDAPVVDLDVAARHGQKLLAARTLTAQDFQRADAYQAFALDFYLLHDENEVEFRLSTRGAARRLALECVTLARRLG